MCIFCQITLIDHVCNLMTSKNLFDIFHSRVSKRNDYYVLFYWAKHNEDIDLHEKETTIYRNCKEWVCKWTIQHFICCLYKSNKPSLTVCSLLSFVSIPVLCMTKHVAKIHVLPCWSAISFDPWMLFTLENFPRAKLCFFLTVCY